MVRGSQSAWDLEWAWAMVAGATHTMAGVTHPMAGAMAATIPPTGGDTTMVFTMDITMVGGITIQLPMENTVITEEAAAIPTVTGLHVLVTPVPESGQPIRRKPLPAPMAGPAEQTQTEPPQQQPAQEQVPLQAPMHAATQPSQLRVLRLAVHAAGWRETRGMLTVMINNRTGQEQVIPETPSAIAIQAIMPGL